MRLTKYIGFIFSILAVLNLNAQQNKQPGPGGIGEYDQIPLYWFEVENLALSPSTSVTEWQNSNASTTVNNLIGGTQSPTMSSFTYNEIPFLLFDNINEKLVLKNTQNLLDPVLETFIVLKSALTSNVDVLTLYDESNTSTYCTYRILTTGEIQEVRNSGGGEATQTLLSAGTFNANEIYVLKIATYKDGSNLTSKIQLNFGVETTGQANSFSALQDVDQLAISGGLNTHIAEISMYKNEFLTTNFDITENEFLQNYYASKYDISIPSDYYFYDDVYKFDASGAGFDNIHGNPNGDHGVGKSNALVISYFPYSQSSPVDKQAYVAHDNQSLTETRLEGTSYKLSERQWRLGYFNETSEELNLRLDLSELPTKESYQQYAVFASTSDDFLVPQVSLVNNAGQGNGIITSIEGMYYKVGVTNTSLVIDNFYKNDVLYAARSQGTTLITENTSSDPSAELIINFTDVSENETFLVGHNDKTLNTFTEVLQEGIIASEKIWAIDITERDVTPGETATVSFSSLPNVSSSDKYVVLVSDKENFDTENVQVTWLSENGNNWEGTVSFNDGIQYMKVAKLLTDPIITSEYNEQIFTLGKAGNGYEVTSIGPDAENYFHSIHISSTLEEGDFLTFGHNTYDDAEDNGLSTTFSPLISYCNYGFKGQESNWFIDYTSLNENDITVTIRVDATKLSALTLGTDEFIAAYLESKDGETQKLYKLTLSGSYYYSDEFTIDQDYYFRVGYMSSACECNGFANGGVSSALIGYSENKDETGIGYQIVAGGELNGFQYEVNLSNPESLQPSEFFSLQSNGDLLTNVVDEAAYDVKRSARIWCARVSSDRDAVAVNINMAQSDWFQFGAAQGFPYPYQEEVLIYCSKEDYNEVTGEMTNLRFIKPTLQGSDYVVEDLFLKNGDKLSLGYLHHHAYSTIHGYDITALGQIWQGYTEKSLSNDILTVSSLSELDENDVMTVGSSSGDHAFTTEGTNEIMNKSWRFDGVNSIGEAEISFDVTNLTLLSDKKWAVFIDNNDDGTFTNDESYLLHDYGTIQKAFAVPIINGKSITLGMIDYQLYHEKDLNVSFYEANGSMSTPITQTIYVHNDASVEAYDPCADQFMSARLKVLFNTGEFHELGQDVFTTSVEVTVVGYDAFTGGNEIYRKDNLPFELTEEHPEKMYTELLNSAYTQLKRIEVSVNNFTTSAGMTQHAKESLVIKAWVEEKYTSKMPSISQVVQPHPIQWSANQTQATFSWELPASMDNLCYVQTYQFQLLKVLNNDPTKVSNDFDITAEVNWDEALTLNISHPKLTMTMAQGSGHYLWRVRPIGNYYEGGVADARNYGQWTASFENGEHAFATGDNFPGHFTFTQFEEDKNWVFSRSFGGEGKVAEQMLWANGLMFGVQTQATMYPSGDGRGPEIWGQEEYQQTFDGTLNEEYITSPEAFNLKVGLSQQFVVTGKVKIAQAIDQVKLVAGFKTSQMNSFADATTVFNHDITPNEVGKWTSFEVTVSSLQEFNYYALAVKAMGTAGNLAGNTVQIKEFSVREIEVIQPVVAGTSVYDYSARASLSPMAVPVAGKTEFGYEDKLLQDNFGQLYTAKNFDTDNNYTDPEPISGGLVTEYYSDLNPDLSIPSAEGYPFSRVLFYTDGTGRARQSGSAGNTLRVGAAETHTVRVAFASVSDDELIRVFGDEAPDARSVHKSITIDANNVISATYVNKAGETLFTSMMKGDQTYFPTQLEKLSSEDEGTFTNHDYLNQNLPTATGGLYSAKTVYFTEQTVLEIEQEVTPKVFSSSCQDFCASCGYKVLIRVTKLTDHKGEECQSYSYSYEHNIAPTINNNDENPSGACAPNVPPLTLTFDDAAGVAERPTLLPGSYRIERIIEVDEAASATYVEEVVQQLQLELDEIVEPIESFASELELKQGYLEIMNTSLVEGYTVEYFDDEGTFLYLVTNTMTLEDLEPQYMMRITTEDECCSVDIPIDISEDPYYDQEISDYELGEAMYDDYYDSFGDLLYKDGENYSKVEFAEMIENMLEYENAQNEPYYEKTKICDCWQANLMIHQQAASASFGMSEITTQGEENDVKPKVLNKVKDLDISFEMVPTFLECTGRQFTGITKSNHLLKMYPFQFANYAQNESEGCEQMLCFDQNMKVNNNAAGFSKDEAIPSWVCNQSCNLQFSAAISFEGHSYQEMSFSTNAPFVEDDYLFLDECVASLGEMPEEDEDDFKQDVEEMMQETKSSLESDCKDACEANYNLFVNELKQLYSDGAGGYVQGKVIEDFYCMAEALVEDCKQNCELTILKKDCDGDPANGDEMLLGVGYKEEMDKISAILAGNFDNIELKLVSDCVNCEADGFSLVQPDANMQVPIQNSATENIVYDWSLPLDEFNSDTKGKKISIKLENGNFVFIDKDVGVSNGTLKIVNGTTGIIISSIAISNVKDIAQLVQGEGNTFELIKRANPTYPDFKQKIVREVYDENGTLQNSIELDISSKVYSGTVIHEVEKVEDDYYFLLRGSGTTDDFHIVKLDENFTEEYSYLNIPRLNVYIGHIEVLEDKVFFIQWNGINSSYNECQGIILNSEGQEEVNQMFELPLGYPIQSIFSSFTINQNGSLVLLSEYIGKHLGCSFVDDYGAIVLNQQFEVINAFHRGGKYHDEPRELNVLKNGYLLTGNSNSYKDAPYSNPCPDIIDDFESTEVSNFRMCLIKTDFDGNYEYMHCLDENIYPYFGNVFGNDIIIFGEGNPTNSAYKFHIETDNCTPDDVYVKWIPSKDSIPNPPPPPPPPPPALKKQIFDCMELKRKELIEEYNLNCLGSDIDEKTVAKYELNTHHHTLFYYDVRGNLVQTVPPVGVDELDLDEAGVRERQIHPAHKQKTQYTYNSIGEMVKSHTPDGGIANVIYDGLGRVRFAQDANQKEEGVYAYTKYDKLSRTYEGGLAKLEKGKSFEDLDDPIYYDDQADDNLDYPVANTYEVTRTYIGEVANGVTYQKVNLETDGIEYVPQHYLRNRISYVIKDEDGDFTTQEDQIASYFSYDPHGRNEWVIQDLPYIGKQQMSYEYDLLNGNVTMVKYNEGYIDQFYHRYDYDGKNRMIDVATSVDGMLWEKDARYQYQPNDGRMNRVILGEDKIQAIDVTSTLQGWLKGINHVQLDALDPGNDGKGKGYYGNVAKDEFGMVLTYFDNDFRRSYTDPVTSDTKNSVFNTDYNDGIHSSAHLAAGTDGLYNGNIATWVAQTGTADQDGDYGNTIAFAYKYKYDVLNRIKSANWQLYSGGTNGTYSNGPDNRWDTHYDFDANGNITQLQRYNNTGDLMDNLTYGYHPEKEDNQLDQVVDGSVDATANAYSSGTHVYIYDKIGNLITESDPEEGTTNIVWNDLGKVEEIEKSNGVNMKFTYDMGGNRIVKTVLNENGSEDYTIYSRDMAGQVMAVYTKTNTSPTIYLEEHHLYGASRVGMRTEKVIVQNDPAAWQYEAGKHTSIQNGQDYTVTALQENAFILSGETYSSGALNLQGGMLVVQGTLNQLNYQNGMIVIKPAGVVNLDALTIPAGSIIENYGTLNIANNITVEEGAIVHNYGKLNIETSAQGNIDNCDGDYTELSDGEYNDNLNINCFASAGIRMMASITWTERTLGKKSYELADHLGNVRVVVADKKEYDVNGTHYSEFTAVTYSYTDYYSYGSVMPGRSGNSDKYRYGFNGAEKDDEAKGLGNQYDLGLRTYDPRLGRMFSRDPRAPEYPWQSPYVYHRNSPISIIDYLGGGGIDDEKMFWAITADMTTDIVVTEEIVWEEAGDVSKITDFKSLQKKLAKKQTKSGHDFADKDGSLGTVQRVYLYKTYTRSIINYESSKEGENGVVVKSIRTEQIRYIVGSKLIVTGSSQGEDGTGLVPVVFEAAKSVDLTNPILMETKDPLESSPDIKNVTNWKDFTGNSVGVVAAIERRLSGAGSLVSKVTIPHNMKIAGEVVDEAKAAVKKADDANSFISSPASIYGLIPILGVSKTGSAGPLSGKWINGSYYFGKTLGGLVTSESQTALGLAMSIAQQFGIKISPSFNGVYDLVQEKIFEVNNYKQVGTRFFSTDSPSIKNRILFNKLSP